MSTGTRHTITAFDDDMDEIRGLIAEMGARAESAVVAAMKALSEHDVELAASIRAEDKGDRQSRNRRRTLGCPDHSLTCTDGR